jgi:hypothetical protein
VTADLDDALERWSALLARAPEPGAAAPAAR